MKYANTLIVLGMAVVLACTTGTAPTDVNEKKLPASLIGTTWDVVSFVSEDGTATDPGTVGLYIKFGEDSTVTGGSYQLENGPVARNSFGGEYIILSDSLFITLNYMTEVNEPEGSRVYEFAGVINRIIIFKIEDGFLILDYDEEKEIILQQRTSY